MDVETITMTKDQAARALRRYRDRSRRKLNTEFDAIEQGYAALAKGTPLLDVAAAIATAPVDEKGRPMFAIARSDRKEVQYIGGHNWEPHTFSTHKNGPASDTLTLTFPKSATHQGQSYIHGYAMVPLVPPHIADGKDLSQYFTFWDIEKWADRSAIDPPRDPYLLKRITGHLFAVLGEWDLTELERAVMRSHRIA